MVGICKAWSSHVRRDGRVPGIIGTKGSLGIQCDRLSAGYLMGSKSKFLFSTGDLVTADIPTKEKAGVHTGQVAIRQTGSFDIKTGQGLIQGESPRHCRTLQRGDGYEYSFNPTTDNEGRAFLPDLQDRVSGAEVR